jgi:hypothetical protein
LSTNLDFIFSYATNTSTCTLRQHLDTVHNILADSSNEDKKQRTITEIMTGARPKSSVQNQTDNAKKFVLVRQLAIMCAVDQKPFQTIANKGFQQLLKWHNVTNLPDPRTVATTGLSDVYSFCKKEVVQILEEAPQHMALVLDCATDPYKQRALINYKVHYCDTDFNLRVVTLKTALFPRPHTADRIKENIAETLVEFHLEQKKFMAVTDNGSNIVAALKRAKIPRMPCVAHKLHLLIAHDIMQNPDFSVLQILVAKMKTIFQALTYRNDQLEDILKTRNMSAILKALEEAVEFGKKLLSTFY